MSLLTDEGKGGVRETRCHIGFPCAPDIVLFERFTKHLARVFREINPFRVGKSLCHAKHRLVAVVSCHHRHYYPSEIAVLAKETGKKARRLSIHLSESWYDIDV